MQNRYRHIIGAILLVSFIFVGFIQLLQQYIHIPKQIVLFEQQKEKINATLPLSVEASSPVYDVTSNKAKLTVVGKQVGKEKLMLHLAGIPVKRVDVQVLSDFKVIPGGQSIGVKLNSRCSCCRLSSGRYSKR